MADVQLENGYLRIATQLMDEIIRRDFSKRQLSILHLIIRLSYGCRRKDCVIEKLNDFEVVGIYKQDTKKELNYLVESKVITWNQEKNIFSLNKNYDAWKINPSKGWDKTKLDSLIHLNLKQKDVSKTLTELVSKTLTEMGKTVSKTLTDKLVKYLLEVYGNAWESKDESTLKDSIKDSYLNIVKDDEEEGSIMERILELLQKSKILEEKDITEFLRDDIDDIITNFGFEQPEELIIEAIKDAARGNGKTWKYVYKKLVAWKNDGYKTVKDIEKEAQNGNRKKVPQHRGGTGRSASQNKEPFNFFGDKVGRY